MRFNFRLGMSYWNVILGKRGAGVLIGCLLLAGCASVSVLRQPADVPVAPVALPRHVPKVGLALGGGAARGFAHVGVIQVLEEAGIRPDFVVGTSAGSLVAAIYASGKSGAQLQLIAEGMEEAMLTDWTLPIFSRGVLRGEALARYVNTQVSGRLIEAMVIPLGIVATDLGSGDGILAFGRGLNDISTATCLIVRRR